MFNRNGLYGIGMVEKVTGGGRVRVRGCLYKQGGNRCGSDGYMGNRIEPATDVHYDQIRRRKLRAGVSIKLKATKWDDLDADQWAAVLDALGGES